MKSKILVIVFVCVLNTFSLYGQNTPMEKGLSSITFNTIKAQMGFLASDWTEGRAAGERGEYLSSDYLASMLQLYNVNPGGDILQKRGASNSELTENRSYFQNFALLKNIPGEEQIFKVKSTDGSTIKTCGFTYNVDFYLRQLSNDIEIDAPVVFAGYGFKNEKLKFNDFNKLDIKGKFILRISGTPAFSHELLTPSELSAYDLELEKIAKTGGAAGIIEAYPNLTVIGSPPRQSFNNMSPAEYDPRSILSNARYSLPGKNNPDNLIRISISVKTANEILKGTGIILDDYIKKANSNQTYSSPPMTGKSVYLKSTVKTSSVAVRNVIGIIEGKDPDNVIVLGAHYDHMGINNGYLWNGADDNASGTVGVLTLAKAIMETGVKPGKTIIIALWTAEEEGLLGSRYWIQNPTCPLKNVRLNVNFDMISRYISEDSPTKVTMTYTSSCTSFREMTATNLLTYGIDLLVDYQPSIDPPGGTDHRSFVSAGIPIMRFKPGHREEYHTPQDELDTIDWDIMEKIIKISFANVWELANSKW